MTLMWQGFAMYTGPEGTEEDTRRASGMHGELLLVQYLPLPLQGKNVDTDYARVPRQSPRVDLSNGK